MKELALHILDIMENSIRAKASKISVSLVEDSQSNQFILTIQDNGKGMDQEVLARVKDPFFTEQNKKVGMGIPLLEQLTSLCGGELTIDSQPGKGTSIRATFQRNHIDLPPLGNLPETLMVVYASHPEIEIEYEHVKDNCRWSFNTKKMSQELGLQGPQDILPVLQSIKEWIQYQENQIQEGV
ncbi:MAG: sensor histidine kinase [Candidatus Atribacteria bacterium]|nr:sensor histidine kinase [Candidatus Atribacteria bacterium]